MPDPDFVALGLGGTNMMAMLWTVAMGRRAVGVEMRGDPFLGVHWNIREDFYHQLGLIDQMMLERYGEARLPRRGDGRLFRLAECFYSPRTVAGDIVADEIIDSYDTDQHIVGTIQHIEFIDDRWRDGLPNRVISLADPPIPPDHPDPAKIRTSMLEVLDGPSMFQAEAASIQKLLRRYLERIEQQDRANHQAPRVRLFTHHRVVHGEDDGFIPDRDGRMRIRIEALEEFDFKGQFVRVREPGSEIIDLGVPELFMIAEGFSSGDAKRLGFEQHDVEVDHGDGRGPLVAQADFLAGLLDVLVGGRLRRRISSEFDQDGKEYWVRQIAVGHENDPEVGWVLVQVPDFKSFDPIEAGLVPVGTDPHSPEFFAAYHHSIYDYYMEQAADILEVPKQDLMQVQMIYGPTLFSLVERVGDDPLIAANGVVGGDSFGNGHFLTSGGAMTGMIGHSARVLDYWRSRAKGISPAEAILKLADSIKDDTHAWLQLSAKEYSQAVPINFGAERIERISLASGIDTNARANSIDAARRKRHTLIPLDPSNWRRLFVHNGKVLSALPELAAAHPQQRAPRAAAESVPVRALALTAERSSAKHTLEPSQREGNRALPKPRYILEHTVRDLDPDLVRTVVTPGRAGAKRILEDADQAEGNRTLLMPWPSSAPGTVEHELRDGDRSLTLLRLPATRETQAQEQPPNPPNITPLEPESARIYIGLDIEENEQVIQRIVITANSVVVGRADPKHGITPDIDLTPFDPMRTVSRQHARIHLEHAAFYIEDLMSRNKTQLAGVTLTPHKPEMLQSGHAIRFGAVNAVVRLLGTSPLPASWPHA
ncbi:MAG TPA: FHA domain-containing protein [Ktedonobacterales bacterium]